MMARQLWNLQKNNVVVAWTFSVGLTLFETGGGQICPGRHKPVCHFRAKCARVTKIHDFVPFHVRLVLEKLFFKFSIFFWKYWRSLKTSKGGTLLCKNQKIEKKIFFLQKSYFFLPANELYMNWAFFGGITHW